MKSEGSKLGGEYMIRVISDFWMIDYYEDNGYGNEEIRITMSKTPNSLIDKI